jgi:Flp pilus assembly pilin Flp
MMQNIQILWQQAKARSRRQLKQLGRDESGATALEFALVSMPFLMMLFGIIAVGLYFYNTFSLENAVEQAARPIRTGQAQATGVTKDQFKLTVCGLVPDYIDCGDIRINVLSFNVGQPITAPSCTDAGGNLVDPAGTQFAPGTAEKIVLVTACLKWKLAGELPFLQLGGMSDGSALIQASTTFKTEPYN